MSIRLRSIALIAAVVLIDRLTKIYIRNAFSVIDLKPVIPGFFNIVHTENPGAAFGMLANSPGAWRGFFLVGVSFVVMVVIAVMLWKPPVGMNSPWVTTGLALVFGGALGNPWDRVFRGTVTDFLQFFFGSYEFPSFNAADSAITIGAALLLIDMWRSRKPPAGAMVENP
jgi:signal peptidase II